MNSQIEATQEQNRRHNLVVVLMTSILNKTDECRRKCPGVGGDVDAMNMRHLLSVNAVDVTAVKQATDRLESLAKSLEVDAQKQVDAMRFALTLFATA